MNSREALENKANCITHFLSGGVVEFYGSDGTWSSFPKDASPNFASPGDHYRIVKPKKTMHLYAGPSGAVYAWAAPNGPATSDKNFTFLCSMEGDAE